ncbi:MAG: OmpA family protein [Mariprofundus sp.]|nr:OmpA family protein [Mariprofundus sp.]
MNAMWRNGFSVGVMAVSVLLVSGCASIIGEAPDAGYSEAQANTPNLINDEEKLRKTLIALRKQDKIAQAKRIEDDKQLLAAVEEKKKRQKQAEAERRCAHIQSGEKLWQRVSFKSGRTAVDKSLAKSLTDTAGKYLAAPCMRKLVVRGFCDGEPIGGYAGKHKSRHAFKSQIALSKARAEAVADVLVKAGIARKMIVVEAYGATNYIADNASLAGRNKNRRVDVFLVGYSHKH